MLGLPQHFHLCPLEECRFASLGNRPFKIRFAMQRGDFYSFWAGKDAKGARLSLFNFAMADDFADLKTYAKSRLSAFDVPFDEIAKEFITSRQKGQLRRLQAFRFTRHSRYNLPAARLKTLEQFIQKRARVLSKAQ